ncbi:2-succinyl-5-enolpyruvyl-6-hydroxy-3-cyclohexene-1-carboxylic-acid synthase [Ferrimonas marina]|uniref:2-succinyl-5-enolpyruvyl-6-hydroxy-3-cyclohexene-1-carboxylate synthase n=1 Tax=Ferrimonas marina TaxID=299255 RepID=A0A1M5ZBJ6_9GAMM|nr:2-succinyl-5-enolpyruvyl-6-hydroxy-3-cyclohexene-1-carboxylic-acid synthase [Ferrimonas marina]SHI21528.1 2-succinyl-5-enolpyruvyl-6-hydroxy-3-cyclohexene-1-carboxylate synthase [Ferrimonas marina]
MSHSADLNLLWARLLLEELHRLGVRHLCLAPGSRSTPLTLAAAGHDGMQRHTHLDERGLAFAALGLAKASQTPVAIITTSGTAVANLYPAIIEAAQTKVPLIVLSGDRPPELIDCGANQAIRQPAIFADYARRLDLPAADLNLPPQALLAQIDQAMADLSGPLHINCMYREPLYPDATRSDFSDYLSPIAQWRSDHRPWTDNPNLSQSALPDRDACQQFAAAKGVIVVGSLGPEQDPRQLLALSRQLGWPLLADSQSQLRQLPGVVHHIDQMLHRQDVQDLLSQAEHLLLVGGRLLSKRLLSFIGEHPWRAFWHYLPQRQNLDPNHRHKRQFVGSLNLLPTLPWGPSAHAGWGEDLQAINQRVEALLQQQERGPLTELSCARWLSAELPHQAQLFIGNSLPIRLYDMLAKPRQQAPTLWTNRGASGIDGLLATACGVALASNGPTVLTIGDISLLHDLNSLVLARQLDRPLVILAMNNDGGSIFNLLPVPNEQLRQDYYRLGHGLTFAGAAEQFGLPYHRPNSLEALTDSVSQALQHAGASLIEVIVPAGESAEQIVALAQQIRDA